MAGIPGPMDEHMLCKANTPKAWFQGGLIGK